jgi:predicted dehydrogenase
MYRDGKIVRVALIGYGFAGKTFHAPLIESVDGLKLTVIGSTKQKAVSECFPNASICSFEDAAVHQEVDLVVIATPNESHYPLAAAALRAGKDVVVDKPFTVTLAEARSLIEIAEQHQRLLSVFHNRRWDSEVLGTKAILSSGSLGKVSHYECHMDRYRPVVRKRWRENNGPGAGLWFDLGPHLIDQALHLFGLPNSVNANFGILREGGETDDWAHVQLNYDRLRVILHATLLAAGRGPRSIVHGADGSWAKYGADVQEAQLISGMLPGDEGFGIDPNPGIFYSGVTGDPVEIVAPVGNQRMYYVGIRDAILRGERLPVTARDALATMAILEASFDSGALGGVLPIPLTEAECAEWRR